jgi:predicted AAA+ superfamily ATPase
MLIDYGIRQSGKTTRLVNILRCKKDTILIVPCLMQKKNAQEAHPDLKDRIFSVLEISRKVSNLKGKKLIIDDAEYVLQQLIKRPVVAISLSREFTKDELEFLM